MAGVARAGSRAACTRVSPPCSGVFITSLASTVIVSSYSWYPDPPGGQGEYPHPPDVNVELGVDHAGVEADADEAVPALVHQPPQLPREHHLANHSSVLHCVGQSQLSTEVN